MPARRPGAGVFDALALVFGALTLVALSSATWYEVNDGYFGAWRFHTWLDLVVAAFAALAVVLAPIGLLLRSPRALVGLGRVAAGVGTVACAMLLARGLLGEPRLHNPSGSELDIAVRHGGVWMTLGAAFLALLAVLAGLWTRGRLRRGAPVAVDFRGVPRLAWATPVAGLLLVWSISADWYGRGGYLEDSGWEATSVEDVVVAAFAGLAVVLPFLLALLAGPAARRVALVAVGVGVLVLGLMVVRVAWLPGAGERPAGPRAPSGTYDRREPGVWVALGLTAITLATVWLGTRATRATSRSR